MKIKEEYMRQALTIARYAEGRTSPNPLVGAVVVHKGRVVGQGWHRKAGTPHAEVHALRQAGELASGATVYVTLEPCCHYGRTPPCSQALIDAGVKRVVVAMADPNPLVAGQGIAMLRQAGIEVIEGVLEKDARCLNEIFLKWITTKLPFVVLKVAMTLDGKIATCMGESQWITSTASRNLVHKMRDQYDSILTGIGTIIADDPSLTARLPDGSGKNPQRIIVDSLARTPLTAKVVNDGLASTLIAVTAQASADKVQSLRAKGVEVIIVSGVRHVDLTALLTLMGQRKISSVFVESGATLNDTMIREQLVDKVHVFIAPKIVGGKTALSPVGGLGIGALQDAMLLERLTLQQVEEDILISGYARKGE